MHALGQTMGMRHPIDRQVLDGDQVRGIDDAPARLVGNVAAPPGTARVDTGHPLGAGGSIWRALLFRGQPALRRGPCMFLLLLLTQATPVGQLRTRAERGKRLQAHLTADGSMRGGQWRRLGTFTRETAVPLARTTVADGGRRGRALQGPVHDGLHQAQATVHHAHALSIRV
jgi:hypothetical protein